MKPGRLCPNLLAALRAVAGGQFIHHRRLAALQRAHLVKVRGHGVRATAILTDAGREALERHDAPVAEPRILERVAS